MVTEKVVKSKKPQKYAKHGRFLTPEGRFLRNSKNGPVQILTQRSYITNFIKIRSLVLPLLSGQTHGRTDGTDLIGPLEKFSGDQQQPSRQ